MRKIKSHFDNNNFLNGLLTMCFKCLRNLLRELINKINLRLYDQADSRASVELQRSPILPLICPYGLPERQIYLQILYCNLQV